MKNLTNETNAIVSQFEDIFTVNVIRATTNLDHFKKVENNRKIRKNNKLKKEIEKFGIKQPIQVNEKMEIIDGQHRLDCAKQLKIEGIEIVVPFYIVPNASQKEMITQNVANKNWNNIDYVEAYMSQNEVYATIYDLYLKYPTLQIANLLAVLRNSTVKGSMVTEDSDAFKDGHFEFWNLDYSKAFLSFYDDVIAEIASFNNWDEPRGLSRPFLASLYEIWSRDTTDHGHLLVNSPLAWERTLSIKDYHETLKLVSGAYNMGGKTKDETSFQRAKKQVNFKIEESDKGRKKVIWTNSNDRRELLEKIESLEIVEAEIVESDETNVLKENRTLEAIEAEFKESE